MSVSRKRCGLCQHEDREELERMLEAGEVTCDELDRKYNWRSGTAAQHQRNHMGDYKMSSNPKCALCIDPMRCFLKCHQYTKAQQLNNLI